MTFGDDFAGPAEMFAEYFGTTSVSIMQSIGANTNPANEPEEYPDEFAADVAADIRTVGGDQAGGEVFDGLQVEATITHVVRIPYLAGVTNKMWVKWGTRRLNIEHVVDRRNQQKFLYLKCVENA